MKSVFRPGVFLMNKLKTGAAYGGNT